MSWHLFEKIHYMEIFMKSWENFFLTHLVSHLLTNQGKNENEDGKGSENEFDLWIFHIKIRLYGYFYENLRRKMKWKCSLTLTICLKKMGKSLMPKTKMAMKKFRRMNLIFEFSISKLGYMTIFMNGEEKIWPIL